MNNPLFQFTEEAEMVRIANRFAEAHNEEVSLDGKEEDGWTPVAVNRRWILPAQRYAQGCGADVDLKTGILSFHGKTLMKREVPY